MIVVNLGPVDRIPVGEGREFTCDGRVIAVFRARAGTLHATQASCPHRGGPLSEGLLGGTIVVCPLHGYSFDVSSGQPLGPGNTCAALRTYPTHMDERGDILVYLPADDAPLPLAERCPPGGP